MTIRYLKGFDNKVADTLSQIEARLDPDTVTELLNHAKAGAPARVETNDIRIIEEEERADQEVILRTIQLARQDKKFRNLRTEDWHQAQLMDPVIPHVLDWLHLPRNNRVRKVRHCFIWVAVAHWKDPGHRGIIERPLLGQGFYHTEPAGAQ